MGGESLKEIFLTSRRYFLNVHNRPKAVMARFRLSE